MNYHEKIIEDIELHNVQGITECFNNGISPNELYKNQPLIYELTSEYTRSPRFKDCVKTFVDHGLEFTDELLLSVLLDDNNALDKLLFEDPLGVNRKYFLRCAYTPLNGVSLLHICAEFNHLACAKVLVKHGANIDDKAAIDAIGFGGHTSIFHTVNQNSNNSKDMLEFLVDHGADLKFTVPGFIWGEGYPWETLIPAINPVSYAMMGLLPQMHRDPKTISIIITRLLKTSYGIDYTALNVPNKYLSE